MKLVWRGFTVLAFWLALASPSAANEVEIDIPPGLHEIEYDAFMEGMVGTAFLSGDFAYLEKKAEQYRSTGARTPTGGQALTAFYRAFSPRATGDHAADERRILALEQKATRWAQESPNVATPHIVLASLLVSHAWMERGDGPENTVTQDGWVRFDDELAQAENYLQQHKAVASSDPYWYVMMLQVALGREWEQSEFEPLLDEAIGRYPGYVTIYVSGASLFSPLWGGNVDAFDAYVDAAVERSQNYLGRELYARIYIDAPILEDPNQNIFQVTRAKWPRMIESLMEIARKYPDPSEWPAIFSYACDAGDKIEARQALQKVPPNLGRPGDVGYEKFVRCKKWAMDTAPLSAADVSPTQVSVENDVNRAVFGPALAGLIPDWLAVCLVWYAIFVFSLVFHEAAHALAAKWGGDSTASDRGLASLNPLVHIRREPLGMVVLPVASLLFTGGVMGWASAPYSRAWAQQHPHRAAWMALAGPGANFLLLAAAGAALRFGVGSGAFIPIQNPNFAEIVVRSANGTGDALTIVLSIVFVLNTFLFLINLLPIPPFDGSSIFALLLPEEGARFVQSAVRYRYVNVAGVVAGMIAIMFLITPTFYYSLRVLFAGLS